MLNIPDKLPILKSLDMAEDILSLTRIGGSDQIFAGTDNGLVYFVDLGAESPQGVSLPGGHLSYISGIAHWKDVVISAGSDRRLVWWDRNTREKIRTVEQAHGKWIRDIVVHPHQGVLATVGDDMVCRLWNIESGERIADLCGHSEYTQQHWRNKLFTCAFSRDGEFLATADQTGRIVVWEFTSRKESAVVEASKFYEWDHSAEAGNGHSYGGIRALDFSPDGSHLAVGGIFNTDAAITNGQALLQIFKWQTGTMTAEFKDGGNFFYENVRFSPDGTWIVATPGAGTGQHVNFFDIAESKLLKKSDSLRTYDMALNETGDVMYLVGPKKIAKLGMVAANP